MITDKQGQEWLLNKLLQEGYTSIDYNHFRVNLLQLEKVTQLLLKEPI